jgi:inner membrane protein YidH
MDPNKNTSEELRLRLQLESNLLTWVRTSIGLMGFGFVVARFGLFLRELSEAGNAHIHTKRSLVLMNTLTGTGMILLGVAVLLISIYAHRAMVDRFEKGEYTPPTRWSLGVILSMILAAVGMGMAIYLTAVEF